MKSIYDGVKSASELVKIVRSQGMSTEIQDICRMQDIIGRSSIEELDFLANDIGRCDEYGNPDLKGTCGNGRKGTRDTFYFILFRIWNYEDNGASGMVSDIHSLGQKWFVLTGNDINPIHGTN